MPKLVAPPNVSSRRLSASDRRVQVLQLAREIISEDGLDALTMDALANRAEVGKPVLYRQFENRDAVLVALFEARVALIDRTVERAIADCQPDDLACLVVKSAQAYFKISMRADHSLQRALESASGTGALGIARRTAADGASRRWAQRFRTAGMTSTDARALSLFLLGGLTRLSEAVGRRELTLAQAEQMYIRGAQSILRSFNA